VRNEKKGELLMARMEEAKKASADIYAIATKVNSVVDTLDSVSFNDYFLGKYGMEPKVQSAIAAAAENTLVGPIQGAQGVYMVKVNAKMDNPTPVDPTNIRSQKEQSFMQGLRNVQQVLKDNAKVVDQRNKFF
jgi:parvulin-like peptidyl-prolyl isomerase